MLQNYKFGPKEAIEIEANSDALFWYDPNSTMWAGNGNREVVKTIPCSKTFKFPPIVHIGMAIGHPT